MSAETGEMALDRLAHGNGVLAVAKRAVQATRRFIPAEHVQRNLTQASTHGLLLNELHRRAGEAATAVPLAHQKFVHPEDTAKLLFALGQP